MRVKDLKDLKFLDDVERIKNILRKYFAYDDNGNRIPKFKIRADGSEKYINIVDNRGAGYHVCR